MNPCRLFAFCLTDAKTVGKFTPCRITFCLLGARRNRALESLQIIVDSMKGEGATIEAVCSRFAAPDRPAIR
jgi:hypothetical protein